MQFSIIVTFKKASISLLILKSTTTMQIFGHLFSSPFSFLTCPSFSCSHWWNPLSVCYLYYSYNVYCNNNAIPLSQSLSNPLLMISNWFTLLLLLLLHIYLHLFFCRSADNVREDLKEDFLSSVLLWFVWFVGITDEDAL